MTLSDLQEHAIYLLRESFADFGDDDTNGSEIIHNIIEGIIPVRTDDLLSVVLTDPWILFGEPELGGKNAYFVIVDVIQTYISDVLLSELEQLTEARNEAANESA